MAGIDITQILGPIRADKQASVGIDLGTAYSGIAFSRRIDSLNVICGAPAAINEYQKKVPTVILRDSRINARKPDFHFGNTALDIYHQGLTQDAEGKGLSLFKRFKLDLKGQESGLTKITSLAEDGRGTESLMKIMSQALIALKEYAVEMVNKGAIAPIPQTAIQWSLTVPAIWNDFGKKFMRTAAKEAGIISDIDSKDLEIVLEPEAAALAVQIGGHHAELLVEKSRFVVLDCGGGTVDITGHEVNSVSPLRVGSLIAPKGGTWGGEYVDKAFKEFLQVLLGKSYNEKEYVNEYYTIFRTFETVKVAFDPSSANDPAAISLLPVLDGANLEQLCIDYNTNNKNKFTTGEYRTDQPLRIVDKVVRRGSLLLSKAIMLSFFEPLFLNMCRETKDVLTGLIRENKKVSYILLVGGFATSKALQLRVRSELENKDVRVLIPDSAPNPQAAIAHGAVFFGFYNTIEDRISRYSYGVRFIEKDTNRNLFHKLVSIGEKIRVDHETEVTGIPLTDDQKEMSWELYRSDLTNPVTTDGQHMLGSLVVPCPRDNNETRQDRQQRVKFFFGGAEIVLDVVPEKYPALKKRGSITFG